MAACHLSTLAKTQTDASGRDAWETVQPPPTPPTAPPPAAACPREPTAPRATWRQASARPHTRFRRSPAYRTPRGDPAARGWRRRRRDTPAAAPVRETRRRFVAPSQVGHRLGRAGLGWGGIRRHSYHITPLSAVRRRCLGGTYRRAGTLGAFAMLLWRRASCLCRSSGG